MHLSIRGRRLCALLDRITRGIYLYLLLHLAITHWLLQFLQLLQFPLCLQFVLGSSSVVQLYNYILAFPFATELFKRCQACWSKSPHAVSTGFLVPQEPDKKFPAAACCLVLCPRPSSHGFLPSARELLGKPWTFLTSLHIVSFSIRLRKSTEFI